jgi:hypothetical protein
MPAYTICPKFIEYAGQNIKYINDVLMVFVPENSNSICIDRNEIILNEYAVHIKNNKNLSDWYRFMTMYKDTNFLKVDINEPIENLPIQICNSSYDKLLITDCKTNYSEQKSIIEENEITILDKDLAKVVLNYGNAAFPVTINSIYKEVTVENVFEVVIEICEQFRDVVENKGLFKLLVNSQGERVHENKAQLLFFGVAYSHCSANDLKLSPEVDSGNGPVDFNISKGFRANVNVEVKFADNPKLEKGLWSQLIIYNRAENTNKSIYLIIKTNDNFDDKIEKLIRILAYRKQKGEVLPEIIVIDSKHKESASVR